MSLQWSDSLPTVEGWYYVQRREVSDTGKPIYPIRCVRVFYLKHWRTGKKLLCYDRAFYAHRINDLEDAPQDASVLSELAGQNQWWCGPLPDPEIWNGE